MIGPHCLIKKVTEIDTLPQIRLLPYHDAETGVPCCMDKILNREAREELLNQLRLKYHTLSRREKAETINALILSTGYSRKAAIRALNKAARDKPILKRQRRKPSRYDTILPGLRQIWKASNYLCGKRLHEALPLYISRMSQASELHLTDSQIDLLLTISAATIDRLLRVDRSKVRPKGRCTTRPGSILLHQIMVKTFAEWNDTKPGYFAMDWVAFCGESLQGEFVYVLSMTDIATGWMALAAFMGRSEYAFTEAILTVMKSLPFALRGIHVDNDSTFINHHVYRFCLSNQITMSRSRPNKNNDNCFVEQKNWDVVRKNLGYSRYDTQDQLAIIKQVLPLIEIYQNVFQPSMRLACKYRDGAKVHKTYRKAKAPLQQLSEDKSTPSELAYMLQNLYADLSPLQLRKQIDALVTKLDKLPQK